MSLPVGEYRCSGCSFVQPSVHQSITLRYVLEDGRYGTAYRQAGWCKACDKVVDVEQLPDASTVMWELAKAERAVRGMSNADSVALSRAEQLVERHGGTLAWLKQRRSRPRCLKCGTEQIVTREHDPSGALRHSCGGVLDEVSPESGNMVRVSVVPIRYVMSVDGLVLRTERDKERHD